MSKTMLPRQLLIGLPGAGKSTFLAALWHVVTSKEIPGALSWVRLKSDTTYIEGIHKKWMRGIPLIRTDLVDIAHSEHVVMELGYDGISLGELIVPDISGEYFDLQWTERQWSSEYQELLKSTASFLLFISPQNINTSALITPEIQAMVHVLSTDKKGMKSVTPGSAVAEKGKEFEPKECRTQAKLVELLQFIASREELDHLRKFTLIVSAWDVLDSVAKSPDAWLKMQLPFLLSYLNNNSERFEYRLFGISAQGAELVTPEEFRLQTPLGFWAKKRPPRESW